MQLILKTRNQIWPATVADAIAMQQRLRNNVRVKNEFGKLHFIAGVDVGYNKVSGLSRASAVLMSFEKLQPLASAVAELPAGFPYVPGLLSFREIPVILKALEKLPHKPDLLLVDGQGIAHPRRFGIAAHLGVITGLPAIGVAKSRLIGDFARLGRKKGSQTPLMDRDERIGTVLRSKDGCNPLFISPGHRVDHDTAVELTLRCLTHYRLPEPTRIADKLSKVRIEGPQTELFASVSSRR